MTPEEICNELKKDHDYTVKGRLSNALCRYDRARRRRKISNQREYYWYYEFKTPTMNDWVMSFCKAPISKSYKGIETVCYDAFCCYYTSIGLRVFNMTADGDILVFNSHFFTRYNERLNLNLVRPLEKVKHFFANNASLRTIKLPKKGRDYIIGIVKDGFILGEIQNDVWTVYKTFIPKEMAFEYQDEIEKELKESLQNQINELLESEEYNKEEYEQLAVDMAFLN